MAVTLLQSLVIHNVQLHHYHIAISERDWLTLCGSLTWACIVPEQMTLMQASSCYFLGTLYGAFQRRRHRRQLVIRRRIDWVSVEIDKCRVATVFIAIIWRYCTLSTSELDREIPCRAGSLSDSNFITRMTYSDCYWLSIMNLLLLLLLLPLSIILMYFI